MTAPNDMEETRLRDTAPYEADSCRLRRTPSDFTLPEYTSRFPRILTKTKAVGRLGARLPAIWRSGQPQLLLAVPSSSLSPAEGG